MKNLVNGIHLSQNAFSESDKCFQDVSINQHLTPFYEDGSNLTITFLSLNRSILSIRLLKSIQECLPNFKGRILIVDNGSDSEDLEKLTSFVIESNLSVDIYETKKNLGVAGGRNKTAELVKTDWFLSVDNDVYFIENPLSAIKECIDKLGVHFLNLPLLNNDKYTIYRAGGNLFLNKYKDSYAISCPPTFNPTLKSEFKIQNPFLSTCLFGTAAVLRTESFIKLGGFDDNMLIGFEDLDFSIKLYKESIKIGNLNEFCAVHGHDEPSSLSDIEYEKRRYSEKIIRESGEYFYSKHNIYAWTEDTKDWINARENDLKLKEAINIPQEIKVHSQNNLRPAQGRNKQSNLPRIALIADVKNWVFHNYAKQIARHLGNSYDFQIFFYGDYSELQSLFFEVKDFDIIHFFWRDALFNILSKHTRDIFASKGWNYNDFILNLVAKINITTSIYDHLLLEPEQIEERKILFSGLSVGYTTVSQRLEKIYESISEYPKPFGSIEDGIDLEIFRPTNLERLYDENREIVIGWVGNSKWGGDGIDHKGLETIIKPAIQSLREEGYNVRGYYADRMERWIPHNEMNEYYNSIDIYVCASDIEGTPNPALESMACGIPIVSTDVGMIPQLFGTLQQHFILPLRTTEHLKLKLIELIKNPQKRQMLSKENLERIKNWTWEKQCGKWDEFFKTILSVSQNTYLKDQRDTLRSQNLEKYLLLSSQRNIADEIKDLELSIEIHRKRVSELEEWTVDLQKEIDNSHKWTMELQSTLKISEERRLEMQSVNTSLNTSIFELEVKTKEMERQVELAQKELSEAKHRISQMQESRFWKLRNKWVKLKGTSPEP